MRFKNDESGQILVFTVLSMTVLCGFMALAIDVGTLFRAKRNVQIAADAAAIAGALAYAYPGPATPTVAAQNAALANGVATSDVTVNTAPTDGYHTGAGYVEVDISQPNPTFFMGMITGGHSLNVGARAVAGTIAGTACIYVTNPTASASLTLQGADTINSAGCGIIVDSTSSSALCTIGGASTVNAPYLNLVGGKSTGGKCGDTPGPAPVNSGSLAQNDPFSSIVWPNPGTNPTFPSSPNPCTSANTVTYAAPTQAQIPTGGVVCFSSPNVTLTGLTLTGPSGNGTIYVFENGVTLSGNVTVTNGTLDINQGSFSQGNAVLTVIAPTSGTYNGIAIVQPPFTNNTTADLPGNTTGTFQDPSIKQPSYPYPLPTLVPGLQVQFGSSGSSSSTTTSCGVVTPGSGLLCGIIYAPDSIVYMQDKGGSVGAAGIISYDLYVKGNLNISSYSAANPSTTPLITVAMVE